ncbi:MAG: hypothetical protein Q8L22_03710 [Reyranella sp.]|nr:hypothetical protein [Reyranella sp.]
MSKLGQLDRIDAFEFAHHLCLQGSGTNPSLGWTNWFSAIESMPNTYEFLQEPPVGTVLPVAMPFQITGAFASNGVKEVVVRHLVKGKPIDVRVAVRPISRLEEEAITSLMPSSVRAYLRYKAADRTLPRDGASFSMRLGSVDIPFAGSTWNDPPRALRHVLHLGVDALWSSVAEIERAILDAFRRGMVAAHLETVLTPTGWPYGPQPFHDAIEACLQAILRERLVSVRVTTTSHCLEVEPPLAPVHYLRSMSPPLPAPV